MNRFLVTVGILGGMGPLATVDFYQKIVRATPAGIDQEHLPVVVWADPSVPDRTEALTADGPDPTPWLLRGAHRLEAMGAAVIATPCNTAHAFLPRVRESIRARMIDMIEETVVEICRSYADVHTVGILASAGTLQARLYDQRLERAGLRVLVPDELTQLSQVTAAIHRVKAGQTGRDSRELIGSAARSLARRGAQAVVAGCTEFPLILDEATAGVPVIDPTAILARAVVAAAQAISADLTVAADGRLLR